MMELRATVKRALDRRGLRGLLGLVCTLDPRTRAAGVLRVYPRNGLWIMQYRDGFLVDRSIRLGEPPAKMDESTVDSWEFLYRPAAGDVVIDVGAGVGTEVGRWSTCVGASGLVLAVEAQPSTFACLMAFCALNHLTNVRPVNLAISDIPGSVLIDDARQHISSTIMGGAGSLQIEGRTLDDLVRQSDIDHVDFLKMNIEGAERLAIRGMAHTLEITDCVCVSCHDFRADREDGEQFRTREEVRRLLADSGFTVVPRSDDPRPWIRDQVNGYRESS